jgi:hypothetical protein
MEFLVLNISIKTDEALQTGEDLSSAIRGLWGRSLKKIYCFQKQLDCKDCKLDNCTYYVLFEKKLSHSEQYHPYIIQAQSDKHGLILVSFSFFGWICQHIDKLLFSILNLDAGILMRSGRRHTLAIDSVYDLKHNCIFQRGSPGVQKPCIKDLQYRPQEMDCFDMTLVSPLRQKHKGKFMNTFIWEAFAKSLINRVRFIDTHFNHGKLEIPIDIDIDDVQVLKSETRWDEKQRRSFRQDTKMSIGGLLGTVQLKGVSPEMLGILKLARYLHAGKQTTFGNGKISLKKCQE